jgi:sugar lactone lactonase YvrE
VDAFGNLFIADSLNNRIRKVDTQGIITTVAGGGTNYPGEGAAATCALLWQPIGVSVDATGNLFIADTGNNRICKVSPTPQGPVLILTNVTAANSGNYQVVVTGSGGSVTSSVAALAVTYAPAITAQPSNVFVTNGNSASFAVAASGTPPLSFQWRCNGTNLTDGTGMSGSLTTNLFLSGVTTNNTYDVVITNAWGSVISRTASLIIFSLPVVAVGPANQSVAVGSTASFAVSVSGTGPFSYQWQCNGTNLPTTNIITTVAGNGSAAYSGDGGPATNAGVNYPGDVALDGSGNLFIADMGSNVIRKVSADGIITTVAGNGTQSYSGDGGQATNASLNLPAGVTLDFFGNLLIADMGNHRIRKVDPTGVIITVAGNGTNSYSGDGGAATNAGLYYPEGVAFDPFGNLFIADRNNSRIREVSPNGIITTVAGIGSAGYSGDGGAATKAQLFYPTGLAVDANGNLLIADMGNQRIRKVSINGIITTVAGNNYVGGYAGDGGPATDARLYCPWKVVADAYGNQFIADNSNSRVRKVDLNGIITTVAGNGASSFSGDGGAATNATLNYLTGVAVDAGGNLFIADHDNNRIRRVDNPQGPVLSLNNLAVGDAGNYQVVVTSPYGSITSSVAKLTVFLPPQHLTAQISGAGLTLQLTGTPNYPYILQSTTNLTPPVIWQSILTNTADASGNWSFVVTNIADLRENYYRAAAQ